SMDGLGSRALHRIASVLISVHSVDEFEHRALPIVRRILGLPGLAIVFPEGERERSLISGGPLASALLEGAVRSGQPSAARQIRLPEVEGRLLFMPAQSRVGEPEGSHPLPQLAPLL